MERVQTILNASLALLAAVAATIFAIAEAKTGIPAITIPVAVATFLLVDWYRVWQPPAWLINVLGVAAFVASGAEFLMSGVEAPLLSGGHLLTYLTCVFLLQPKGPRQVWWLCGLSLLQVAISSLLTYESWFGLMMPVFLLLAMWTLSVFQLYSASLPTTGEPAAGADATAAAGKSAESARWLGHSMAGHATQRDERQRWITGRFIASTLTGTGLSLGLAAVFFLLIPRVWLTGAPVFFEGGRPVGGAPAATGYTSNIALGQVGQIQESSRVALEVRMVNRETGEPVDWLEWSQYLGGALRLRGGCQEVYDRGRWRRRDGDEYTRLSFDRVPRLINSPFTQQLRIHEEPSRDAEAPVFVSGVALNCLTEVTTDPIEVEPLGWIVVAPGATRRGRIVEYQLDVAPADLWFPHRFQSAWGVRRDFQQLYAHYFSVTTWLQPGLRDGLTAWLTGHPELLRTDLSQYELAKHWERWFLLTKEFDYSLNLELSDPGIDPLLDFLKNTRRGHCEYFASALALLLRTQGIPTRVVSGYKGGQIDASGRLTVRDLHAHLWLEAYVADAPQNPVTGQSGPRWITLDPTPAARDTMVQSQELEATTLWARMREKWQTAWSTSIRMNQGDQFALVYAPVQDAGWSVWSTAREMFTGRGLAAVRQFVTSPQEWFSWRGGLAAFVLLSALAAAVIIGKRLSTRWSSDVRAHASTVERRPVPAFYEQLLKLLRLRGLIRTVTQTPREFAAGVGQSGSRPLSSSSCELTSELTERFYAVRYGDQPLSAAEEADIEKELGRLAEEVQTAQPVACR